MYFLHFPQALVRITVTTYKSVLNETVTQLATNTLLTKIKCQFIVGQIVLILLPKKVKPKLPHYFITPTKIFFFYILCDLNGHLPSFYKRA